MTAPLDTTAPVDDGAAAHLPGLRLPHLTLPAHDGSRVDLGALDGLAVLYAYPMTARPDVPSPDGWAMIPGARGCTPQSCAFRDHQAELAALGVRHLFGVSTQDSDWQAEAAARLHLPFRLLSDASLALSGALRLPVFHAGGLTLLRRLTLIAQDGVIARVHYPVFPPDADAARVLDWLRAQGTGT